MSIDRANIDHASFCFLQVFRRRAANQKWSSDIDRHRLIEYTRIRILKAGSRNDRRIVHHTIKSTKPLDGFRDNFV